MFFSPKIQSIKNVLVYICEEYCVYNNVSTNVNTNKNKTNKPYMNYHIHNHNHTLPNSFDYASHIYGVQSLTNDIASQRLKLAPKYKIVYTNYNKYK